VWYRKSKTQTGDRRPKAMAKLSARPKTKQAMPTKVMSAVGRG
jgi:hypothetical protein